MNIRKGFFRLTLVLSILTGMITPFCHEWVFDEKNPFSVALPDGWGTKSLEEKLNTVDGLFINTDNKFFKDKIKRLNTRRQLRERIISDAKRPVSEWDQYLSAYGFFFEIGWRELSLLAFVGFAFPWLIYLFIKWVIIAFIIGGFRHKVNS